ncbi:MAG: HlyD family efflux transporter periplasmic adaptor subunit [Pseudomonadota bacterium]
MRFLRRSMVGVFLLAVTLGVLGYAAQTIRGAVQTAMSEEDRQRTARERVVAANVVPFVPGPITPTLTTFGEVRSLRTLEVRAPASGSVITLSDAFVEGGQVTAGDLLLEIDPSDAQSALDVAQADLDEALAEQADAAAALDLAKEDVASDQAQWQLRIKALDRARELFQRQIGTEAAVESAELAEATAAQSVLAKRQALANAEARVSQAATGLARRQIALAEAERRLDETKLFAEFSGTLSAVNVVEGGLIQNNERLAELVDPSALEVAFRVSTAEYARLIDDQGALTPAPVTIALDGLGANLTAAGNISRESAVVGDGLTGRQIFARIDAGQGFRPGDFVTVDVTEPVLRFAVALPATAVDAQGNVLVVGDEDRLQIAPVNVLHRQGDTVIVRSRDVAGRDVVAERSPLLGAGIKVRPIRPDQSTAPAEPELVELTAERRARLVAFVEGNKRMPNEAKKRVLAQLEQDKVPAQIVERLESRLGG